MSTYNNFNNLHYFCVSHNGLNSVSNYFGKNYFAFDNFFCGGGPYQALGGQGGAEFTFRPYISNPPQHGGSKFGLTAHNRDRE